MKNQLVGFLLYLFAGSFDVFASTVGGMFASHDGQRVNRQHDCQYGFLHMCLFIRDVRWSFPYFPLLPVREILS